MFIHDINGNLIGEIELNPLVLDALTDLNQHRLDYSIKSCFDAGSNKIVNFTLVIEPAIPVTNLPELPRCDCYWCNRRY